MTKTNSSKRVNMDEPPTPEAALTAALYLAIIAPTDERAAEAVGLANTIAAHVPAAAVRRAKAAARRLAVHR